MPGLNMKWIFKALLSFLLILCFSFIGCASGSMISGFDVVDEEEFIEEEVIDEEIIIDAPEPAWDVEEAEVTVWPEEYTDWESTGEPEEEEKPVVEVEEKKPFRIKDRSVNIGFLHLNAGFSNNFITSYEILKTKLQIDIDKLADGLNLTFGLALNPIFFNYNKDNLWGYGFSTGLDFFGSIGLSGEMLSFKEAKDNKSELAGAAFLEVGFPFFFHVEKFKIKVKPALYYPLAIVDPDITYNYINRVGKDGKRETIINLNYKVDVYTAFPMNFDEGFNLTATPGADFHLGVEYPISDELNLQSINFILDFDVGLDIIGLPFIASNMYDYMRFKGKVGSNKPIDLLGAMLADEGLEETSFEDLFPIDVDEEPTYGENKKIVLRPFKMLLWADWRPFQDKRVTFIPTLGFSINTLYETPGSFEGGIKSRLDLANLFIITLGTGYYDRLWKNTMEMVLNFKAFRFDLTLGLQSVDFVKSWSGGGFGVGLGFTFGW
jgi:hypothetical protein